MEDKPNQEKSIKHKLRPKIKFNIIKSDDDTDMIECHYCHDRFFVEEITKDHKVPKSDGGKTNQYNIVPCCKRCNFLKANVPYPKFKQIVYEFGLDIHRVSIPSYSHGWKIEQNALTYFDARGKLNSISPIEEIGFGSSILTTFTIRDRTHIFIKLRKDFDKQ